MADTITSRSCTFLLLKSICKIKSVNIINPLSNMLIISINSSKYREYAIGVPIFSSLIIRYKGTKYRVSVIFQRHFKHIIYAYLYIQKHIIQNTKTNNKYIYKYYYLCIIYGIYFISYQLFRKSVKSINLC